jgi:nucleoside phosphorylase
MRSFTNIQLVLMVGIGGGTPSREYDVRLGDVVVGVPTGRNGGGLHYEFGKATQNHGFLPTGHLNSPPRKVLAALQELRAMHHSRGHRIASTISLMIQTNPRITNYAQPDLHTDILFRPSFAHLDDTRDCMESCIKETEHVVPRLNRDKTADCPVIHYGLIVSADRLMKNAYIRDRLAKTEGVNVF